MIRHLLVISLIWAIIILVISGMPGDSIPQSRLWSIPQFDKIVHMGLYFPLGFFLAAEFLLSSRPALNKYWIPITLLIIGFYGGIIEIAQGYLFIHRSADWFDFFSDLVGGSLGMLLFNYVGYKIFRKLRKK